MKIIQEFKDSVVVECDICKHKITINRDSMFLELGKYKGNFKCECGNQCYCLDITSPYFKSVQTINDSKDPKGTIGCLTAIGGFVLALITALVFDNLGVGIVILIVMGIIGWVLVKTGDEEKRLRKQNLEKENSRRVEDKYKEIKKNMDIPSDSKKVKYKNGYADITRAENFMWIDNETLCFFPADCIASEIDKAKVYKISLDRIEYYATRGEIVHENKITGGGGGGSSVKGAVVGGVIAGGAGAVIGSRKKTDPIKSELITHDNRETFLNFFDDNKVKHSMFFEFKDYDIFKQLIPEKDYNIVSTIQTNSIISKVINESKSANVTDQIRELAKLKDEGILTEEEFAEKKKALLDKIG